MKKNEENTKLTPTKQFRNYKKTTTRNYRLMKFFILLFCIASLVALGLTCSWWIGSFIFLTFIVVSQIFIINPYKRFVMKNIIMTYYTFEGLELYIYLEKKFLLEDKIIKIHLFVNNEETIYKVTRNSIQFNHKVDHIPIVQEAELIRATIAHTTARIVDKKEKTDILKFRQTVGNKLITILFNKYSFRYKVKIDDKELEEDGIFN